MFRIVITSDEWYDADQAQTALGLSHAQLSELQQLDLLPHHYGADSAIRYGKTYVDDLAGFLGRGARHGYRQYDIFAVWLRYMQFLRYECDPPPSCVERHRQIIVDGCNEMTAEEYVIRVDSSFTRFNGIIKKSAFSWWLQQRRLPAVRIDGQYYLSRQYVEYLYHMLSAVQMGTDEPGLDLLAGNSRLRLITAPDQPMRINPDTPHPAG